MSNHFVAVLMGSDSDAPVVQKALDVLTALEISYEVKITSAHRTPHQTVAYVEDAEQRGCQVFICAAGLAAHLAGSVAAHTLKPVIGLPLASGSLQGMDALLSTVQMPGGIPVACVAIGSAGAKNAGFLSAQILALQDPALQARLVQQRQEQVQAVQAKDKALHAEQGYGQS